MGQRAGMSLELGELRCGQSATSRDRLPDGQIFHAAGPSDGGWTVVAVHESKETWERFRNSILMPRMQQGIEGGFTSEPHESAFEVHNPQPKLLAAASASVQLQSCELEDRVGQG